MTGGSLRLGIERLGDGPVARLLRGARLGLLVNQASVDAGFVPAQDLVAARFPGQLRALFGPQHGFLGEQQDNMVETPHARHPRLGVPVFSLYGETRQPTPAMLADLDVLLVDLQDVGCRVYTFIWTLALCLRACAAAGVRVVVLDRPNPLGGSVVEGNRQRPDHLSFVGLHPIPMRHALTIGEMARYLNAAMALGAEVEVVALEGWDGRPAWRATGRPWLPPSPNLPRLEGVDVYPGQVLVEGTNLSEGRGTTTPFEVFGAPFIDPERLGDALAGRLPPGVVCRPVRFEPTFHKWCGQSCGGLFLHVVAADRFAPYRTTLTILAAVAALWPDAFAWRQPPYEYELEKLPIDILAGDPAVRRAIESGGDPTAAGSGDAAAWWRETAPYRLYPST